MNANQIEQIILAKFEERSGYDDSLKIREAAQDISAALQPWSGLVEALEFYADDCGYNDGTVGHHGIGGSDPVEFEPPTIYADHGEIARQALAIYSEGEQFKATGWLHEQIRVAEQQFATLPPWLQDLMQQEEDRFIHPPKGEK